GSRSHSDLPRAPRRPRRRGHSRGRRSARQDRRAPRRPRAPRADGAYMTDEAASASDLFALIRSLWSGPFEAALADLLPTDPQRLAAFYDRLRAYVAGVPRLLAGTIDPAACVQGEIVSMGPGSLIEAGAIVHRSCRLVLGANSVVRAGAVLRDEVVVGPDSL